MKTRIVILFCIALSLFSCYGNKKDKSVNSEDLQQKSEGIAIEEPAAVEEKEEDSVQNTAVAIDEERRESIRSKVTASEEEKEAMSEFIYNTEKRIKDNNSKIVFIEKANFGITGGENWIVRLSDRGLLVYAINDSQIIKRYYFTSSNLKEESTFDIMEDIPGTRIGGSTSAFGDYNGDGVDEIFAYGFGGNAYLIGIDGYDVEKDCFVPYTFNSWITFEIIDSEKGPAPVEFITYNGIFGFKVYFFAYDVAGGIGYVSEPNPQNGKWIFYTWDAERREYVEIGEVVE